MTKIHYLLNACDCMDWFSTLGKSSRRFFGLPQVFLLGLGVILFLLYLGIFFLYPDLVEIRNWLSRFTVTTLGSYIVIILVDETLRRREFKEKERIRNLALEQLEGVMNRHLGFLTEMYVASVDSKPEDIPGSYDEFFDEHYVEAVQHLDLSEDRPGHQGVDDWFDFVSKECDEFQENVEGIIERYAPFLESGTLQELQNLSRTTLIGALVNICQGQDLVLMDAKMGVVRDYNLLKGGGMDKALQEHLDSVNKVVSLYEETESTDLNSVDSLAVWWENVHPYYGCARIQKPLDDTDPKFNIGPNPLAYEKNSDGESIHPPVKQINSKLYRYDEEERK